MSEFDRVFNEYEQEVLALIPILEEWWSEIAEVRRGKTDRDDRWPLGFSGHPRFIAIFRRYALRILELNEQLGAEDGASAEELWHRGEEDQEDRSVRPRSMLIDDFLERHPEHREQFRMFTFIPLGALDYAAVYPEE
jgi:hypothetical protein